MPSELVMPKLGLTMTEGILQEWLIQPGESYSEGQVIFLVETEKVVNDVEARAAGTLIKFEVQEGETVPVGAVVAQVSEEADGTMNPESERIYATPYARNIAQKHGVSLEGVTATGAGGMIKAKDVESHCKTGALGAPSDQVGSSIERIKPSAVQRAMADRLASVKQGTPHFYLSTEAEVSRLLQVRRELNEAIQPSKLTLTHYLVAALGYALKEFPNINRVWDDGEIVQYSSCNVSVAVETDHGLYVPVVVDVVGKNLSELVLAIDDAIERCRNKKLKAHHMADSAITLSNAGMFDVTWLTPIINQGQSSIIGAASVREVFRPDDAGKPVLKKELGLVFSGDHRLHTGVEGIKFLNRIKFLLENPLLLSSGGW